MNATAAATAARNEAIAARNPQQEEPNLGAKRGDGEEEGDSSSMVVLARVKRKHVKRLSPQGAPQNGSSLSNTTESNSNSGGSATSSEKRVRIQHHPQRHHEPNHLDANAPNVDNNDNGVDDNAENDMEDDSNEVDDVAMDEGPEDGNADNNRQEGSSSASSSDDRNNAQVHQGVPLRYAVPAVVSEYSSSALNGNGSSGASSGMPLSGSGSGGNTASGTGSGTGSGSNQGGSSGSGNDQEGGLSSNGNGSSGSGNDAKGSSEEMMDNSGENNSGENSGENSAENSDSSNKAKLEVPPKAIAAGGSSNAVHRNPASPGASPHHQNHHHSMKPPPLLDLGDNNAVRERKIQDKKRKRMNMRREYEEKVEQEMESSESSRDREVVIRPGKPVTLDKVLSFTKTPRLVVKAGPPFLIVYTNAAYSRLSGIDSHNAVGKPITSLLNLPDQEELMQVDPEKGTPALENSTVKVANPPEATDKEKSNPERSQAAQGESPSTSENYASAEAAGRLQASREDSTELGLERLIAASGFGRIHMINVRSKPHHMLGRNVKVFKPAASIKRSQEEGSNGSTMTSSYDGPSQVVACTMSISPVVSSPEAYSAAVVTDREKGGEHHHHYKHARSDKDQDSSHQHKAKRRKHHHHHQHGDGHIEQQEYYYSNSPNEIPKRQLITHYVIQLDVFDGDFRKLGGMESPSSVSTTLEANMLGMTKAEVRRYRMNKAASLQRPAESGQHET